MTGTTGTGPRAQGWWLVPLLAVIFTTLAGTVVLWAVRGHQTSRSVVPMAIVNSDQPVTQGSGSDAKTIAAGRQLAAGLSSPDVADETALSWQLVDSDDAAKGLTNGTYYGVLTIPKDFSKAVTSTSGTDPEQAQLKFVSNDAASAAVAVLAQVSVNQAAQQMGAQVTNNYVDAMLQNLTKINSNLTSSAKDAQSLADSAHQLADSAGSLADSADQLADGAKSLDNGTETLLAGTKSLAGGAAKSAKGAKQEAAGARELAAAAAKLSKGAKKTADGAAGLAQAATRLDRLAAGIDSGAHRLSSRTSRLADGLQRTSTAARLHAAGAAQAADRAAEVAADCPAGAGTAYCDRVAELARRSRVEARAARALDGAVAVQRIRAQGIHRAADDLDRATGQLAAGLDRLVPAATEVAGATKTVSKGAGQLDSAAAELAKGAAALASGTSDVATGAAQTESGVQQMSVAAAQLASGSTKLASGAHQLADGAVQLADGADQLADGLASGAKQVPSYSTDERDALDTAVTTPVTVKTSADNPSTIAAGMIPMVLGIALWLGTLMMLLARSAVPSGSVWAQAAPVRRVLAGLSPIVLTGVVQATLLIAVVAIAKVPISSPAGLLGFGLLGALSMAAINQALVVGFGNLGRLLSLFLLLVGAAALSGLVPIETAPAPVQALNGVLPLPQFVNGAGQLLLGGHGSLLTACLVLTLWTLIAVAASILVVSRRSLRPSSDDTPSRPQQ